MCYPVRGDRSLPRTTSVRKNRSHYEFTVFHADRLAEVPSDADWIDVRASDEFATWRTQ